MNMNAVGIDVSKRKSTVAILHPGGTVVVKPFDVPHLSADFQSLKKLIRNWMVKPALSWSVPAATMNRSHGNCPRPAFL